MVHGFKRKRHIAESGGWLIEDERDSRGTSRASEAVLTAMPQVALLGYPLNLTFDMRHTFG